MEEGAMGLGTSLIYPPAAYASTEELIALSKVASHYGGMYIMSPEYFVWCVQNLFSINTDKLFIQLDRVNN